MNPFDPYYTWLGIPPRDQPPDHYRLVGIEPFETNIDVIANAADKQMLHVRSFQSGPHAEVSQKLLNELSAARLCLMRHGKKAEYDKQLRAKLAVSALPKAERLATPSRPIGVNSLRGPVGQQGNSSVSSVVKRTSVRNRRRSPLPAVLAAVSLLIVAAVAFIIAGGRNQQQDHGDRVAFTTAASKTDREEPRSAPTDRSAPERAERSQRAVPHEDVSSPVAKLSTDQDSQRKKAADSAKPADSSKAVVDEAIPDKQGSQGSPADETEVPQDPPPEQPSEVAENAPANEPEATQASKPSAPEGEVLRAAEKLVDEVFGKEIAASKTTEQRCAMANRLIDSANESDGDDAERYVLWQRAAELAAQAGNGILVAQSIDALAEHYDVDTLKFKARVYNDAGKGNPDAKTCAMLAEEVLALGDEALAAERYELATPLAKLAQTLGRKAQVKELSQRIAAHLADVAKGRARFEAANKAAKVLAESPDDAAANLIYGQYLCLIKDDWAAGLGMLSKSNDAKLKAAATLDLAVGSESKEQIEAGDAWYELAAGDNSYRGYYARANFWYSRALPGLSGLTKTRVANRLEELAGYAVPDGSTTAKPPTSPSPNPESLGENEIAAPIDLPGAAPSETATKLEERMTGIFQVTTVNKRTKEQLSQPVEFRADGQVLERGKEAMATWEQDKTRIRVTFNDTQRGTVMLRPQKDAFVGLQKIDDGQSVTWHVQPVVVAAIWEIQNREGTYNNTFTLYSNGKLNDPYGELTWTRKGNSLVFHYADEPPNFTIDPGGRTLNGRWLRGAYMVGRLVPAK